MQNFGDISNLKRHVLIVEDELINREILKNILSADYEVHTAENGEEALKILRSGTCSFSLILADLLMPVMDGFEMIRILREDEALRTIPVIVMTSEADAEVRSIKMGAADFITKPYDLPDVILARCERIIELQENKSIIHDTEKDHLTGLYSREYFVEYIKNIEKYKADRQVDILAINIEHFHLLNELHGRRAGDNVLIRIGQILKDLYEEISGIACRSEADCFFMYCDHLTDPSFVLNRLNKGLSDSITSHRIRLRMGVYSDVDKSVMVENWLDRAKSACDRIRGDYSTNIAVYNNDLFDQAKFQERLINDMDDAIANNNFIVFYQPKYDIRGDKPVLRSAEALIRWKHPDLGMISPGSFIPLFESNGLIQKLDLFVWKEAAKQIGLWKKQYGVSVPVSVNVSRMDIYYPELKENFIRLLQENGLAPNELLLEITESAYAENAEQLISTVENLRESGFMIEMDDFGSGYSSLNMLTSIPLDALKLDMKFVRNMEKDAKSMKLVELVLDIAEFLHVPVIAEGVETSEQLKLLKERGCDIIQGYYFSKPVPAEEFKAFIEKEL
jgi:diguanylate cyclase (GGDEF)-like protein